MRIAIMTSGRAMALVEHCKSADLTEDPSGYDVVFTDDPSRVIEEKEGRVILNTSTGLRALLSDKDVQRDVTKLLELVDEPPTTFAYGWFNGNQFSDFMEISFSDRLMTGEVGPNVSFSTGCGFKIDDLSSIPLDNISDFFSKLHYRGSLAIGLTPDFRISSVNTFHLPAFFAMFQEAAGFDIEGLFSFASGQRSTYKIHDSSILGVLISRPPFPCVIPAKTHKEFNFLDVTHCWREQLAVGVETAIITSHGEHIGEARGRLYVTIRGGREKNSLPGITDKEPDLMFRNDAGYGRTFVINGPKYDASLNKTKKSRTEKIQRRRKKDE